MEVVFTDCGKAAEDGLPHNLSAFPPNFAGLAAVTLKSTLHPMTTLTESGVGGFTKYGKTVAVAATNL